MKNKQLDHEQHQRKNKKHALCVLAHDIELPMNIGSLFRIADALGVEKIYLSGKSPAPPHSKIRKTSRATETYVPYAVEEDPLALLEKLKQQKYTIISLEITATSVDIRALSLPNTQKICIVLGSEKSGVNQALLDASDITTHIQMSGQNSSMNVATACAIAVFEITKNRDVNH